MRGKCELIHGVPIASKKYGLKHNNNCAERDNERIKQRYKTTRGFKNPESAEDILKLIDNCYNFVHPHMSLNGRAPAEKTGIIINLERNKLMNLIERFHNSDFGYLLFKNVENFSCYFLFSSL